MKLMTQEQTTVKVSTKNYFMVEYDEIVFSAEDLLDLVRDASTLGKTVGKLVGSHYSMDMNVQKGQAALKLKGKTVGAVKIG